MVCTSFPTATFIRIIFAAINSKRDARRNTSRSLCAACAILNKTGVPINCSAIPQCQIAWKSIE